MCICANSKIIWHFLIAILCGSSTEVGEVDSHACAIVGIAGGSESALWKVYVSASVPTAILLADKVGTSTHAS